MVDRADTTDRVESRVAAEVAAAEAKAAVLAAKVAAQVAADRARDVALRVLRQLIVGYMILALGVVFGFYKSHQQEVAFRHSQIEFRSIRARQTKQSDYAFCARFETIKEILHTEHTKARAEAEAFLRKNQNGIPGIPAALIRRGIAREKEIIAKTRPLDCKKLPSQQKPKP